jgi:hypothetical protein
MERGMNVEARWRLFCFEPVGAEGEDDGGGIVGWVFDFTGDF